MDDLLMMRLNAGSRRSFHLYKPDYSTMSDEELLKRLFAVALQLKGTRNSKLTLPEETFNGVASGVL